MTTEELIQEHGQPLLLELEYADEAEHSVAVEADDETSAKEAAEARSKKEQILALYEHGTTDIAEIVRQVSARPSYIAQVLQSAGHSATSI